MVSLRKSWISEYFDEVSDSLLALDSASFLEKTEAAEVWREHIGGVGSNFFKLHGDSWIIAADWKPIGAWLNFSNNDDSYSLVPSLVSKVSGWDADQDIFLIRDRENIIKMKLKFFCEFWRELLLAFDDAPLLVACVGNGWAFRFAPIGTILAAFKNDGHTAE
jgi:Protein of unknown function (DUF2947)